MATPEPVSLADLLERADVTSRAWIEQLNDPERKSQSSAVATLLGAAQGRDFALGAVDGVFRPQGWGAAAGEMKRVAHDVPAELPWYVRSVVKASGAVAPVIPPVVPLARSAVRSLIGPLVLEERPKKLAAELAKREGSDLLLAPLMNAAVGAKSAKAARERVIELIQVDGVEAVSVRVGALVTPRADWAFAANIERAIADLAPVFDAALANKVHLNIEVGVARELDFAVAVLTESLEQKRLSALSAGITLPVTVAATLTAVQELAAWSSQRAKAGGEPLTLRLSTAPLDPAEAVTERINGWPVASLSDPIDIHANFARSAQWANARSGDVRWIAATADPLLIALARELGASAIQLPFGVAPSLEEVIAPIPTQLRVPVIAARDVESAFGEVVRMLAVSAAALAEVSVDDNTDAADVAERAAGLTGVLTYGDQDRSAAPAQRNEVAMRHPASADTTDMTEAVIGIAKATQISETTPLGTDLEGALFGGTPFVETAVFEEREVVGTSYGAPGFRNEPETDPAVTANREWATALFEREAEQVEAVPDARDVERLIRAGTGAWEQTSAAERAVILERAAESLERRRADLIVAARAAGVLFADADHDVTYAVDAAAYYAAIVRELDTIAGAVMVPAGITGVIPARSDVVASAAEPALAALATGSAVILESASRTSAVMHLLAEALHEAGVPADAVAVASGIVGSEVDVIVMAGRASEVETISRYAKGSVNARVTTTNVAIVMPTADPVAAARDLVASAFGRAGQSHDNVTVAILVGSAARSEALAASIADAAAALQVGPAEWPETTMGELVDPTEADLWALTTLDASEHWLIEPVQISPNRYSAGVRTGLTRDSRFVTERFLAPVLGIMSATSLAEALELHNAITGGEVAVLHTSDAGDVEKFLHDAQAASLSVSRATTNPRVQRQPVGGWADSMVGTGQKAGGPNRLVSLGSWRPTNVRGSSTLHLRGLDSRVAALIEAAQPDLSYEDFERVRRGALSDALAWDREFGRIKDVSRLGVERNLSRYRPALVALRATTEATIADIVRMVVAAVRSRAHFTLSTGAGLPSSFRRALSEADIAMFVETDAEFGERIAATAPERVRVFGPGAADTEVVVREALPRAIVIARPATTAGRIELLPFLKEQSISMATWRGATDADPFTDVI